MKAERGFVLIFVLVLLGLLVLVVVALSGVTRISARTSSTAAQQNQARQNALLGLRIALGELQRHAGPELRITAMAGMTGVAPGNRDRHWCGVWDDAGNFLSWLSSGAGPGPTPAIQSGLSTVRLLGNASVGAANTANREQVDVGRAAIANPLAGSPGAPATLGAYAYWVGDDGVKVSAYPAPGYSAAVLIDTSPLFPVTKPLLATNEQKVWLFEQFKFATSAALTPTELQVNYHHVAVVHSRLVSDGTGVNRVDGLVNINTTSNKVWAALGRTFNTYKPALLLALSDPVAFGDRMRDQTAAVASANKIGGGPFLKSAGLIDSGLLASTLVGTGIPPEDFLAVIEPVLTLRSDTYRIRAYGDAVNPATPARIEARAFCEAIIQRQATSNGLKFVIIAFRWMTADDV